MSGRALTVWACSLLIAWSSVVTGEAMLVAAAWSSPGVGSIYMLSSMVATLLTLVGVIVGAMAFRQAKGRALAVLAACVGLAICGTYFDNTVRQAGFRRCGERLRPMVAAIRDYEVRHGHPPGRPADTGLTDAAQSTGLGAYQQVFYEVPPPDRPIFGNRWMLRIEAFSGTGWDQFIFLPNGNYPQMGFGGRVERIGEWAYVHD